MKTAVHEMAHAILHDRDVMEENGITTEVNVSSAIQCQKTWVERNISKMIEDELENEFCFAHKLEASDVKDPIDILRNCKGGCSAKCNNECSGIIKNINT